MNNREHVLIVIVQFHLQSIGSLLQPIPLMILLRELMLRRVNLPGELDPDA